MKTLLLTDIGRLRLASLADAISYLVLLLIAMPLKYLADLPVAVTIVGTIHGGLFIALCLALLLALVFGKIPFAWSVITFICAVIPLAPFFLDRKLRTFHTPAEIANQESGQSDPA